MAQQTGSISFEATNAVHLSAEGQYESLSDNLRDNYYTKSEFTVAPDKILSTVKEQSEQSARPNLTPWFSHPMLDVWDATENPDGYWSNSAATWSGAWTNLKDGWAHIDVDNSAGSSTVGRYSSGDCNLGWMEVGKQYTILLEGRNCTGEVANIYASTGAGDTWLPGSANLKPQFAEGSFTYWQTLTAKAPSGTDVEYRICNFRIQVAAGKTASGDFRFSIYEGEYSGPYKPYVDQSLITRVSTAETAIEQNAEAITLRATKTEAQQMAQPNLVPWFSAGVPSLPSTYWKYASGTKPTMTDMGDGWVHMRLDNADGTKTIRFDYDPVAAEGIECGKDYTLLFELRNISGSSGDARIYAVQAGTYGMQFWGASAQKLLQGFSTDCNIRLNYTVAQSGSDHGWAELCDDGVYRKRVVRKSEASDSQYWTRSDDKRCVRLVAFVAAGAVYDAELRFSIYEGIYEGPYKPYSGTQLYASQAQLKVANDQINLRVEKSGVISSINQSAETIKISADKVQIDGTAVFSAIEDQLDAAYDAKGAAAIVQENLDNLQVGGRNLLRSSGVWEQGTWMPRNGAHIASTTRLRSSKDGWYVPVEPNATYVIGRHAVDSSVDYYVVLYAYDSSGAFVLTDSVTEWITSFPYTYVPATATRLEVGIRRSDNANISVSEAAAARLKLERGNKATDWSPAPEDQSAYVDSSIDGIQVGGRNLLRRTATPFSYAINTTNYGTHHLYSTGSMDTAYDGPTLEELGFGVGDEVTFTFDWKTSQNGSAAIRYGSFRVEYYGVTSSGTNGYITAMAGGVVTMSESNASGRFSRTATLTAATIKTQRMVLRIDNSALVFTVSNAKLEKGNKATDWTPAPEDVTSRTQRIYYRTSSSTAPTSQYMPTAWVTETGDKWAANSTTVANWTAKATKLTNGSGTKYPYLFTCEQRQMGDGTLAYTTVLLDETTTVIDGGTIITGSVHANSLDADSVKANIVQTTDLSATKITSGDIATERMSANVVKAVKAKVSDLYALVAKIGGFVIDATSIRTAALTSNADNSIGLSTADFTRTVNGTSRAGLRFAIGDKFGVTGDGTLYANGANITSINAGNISSGSITADRIKANVISAVNNGTGTINADKVNVSAITIGQSQVTNLTTDLGNKANSSDLTAETSKRKATYGTCSTAAGTADKVVTCANFELYAGAAVTVTFTTANTAVVPKLNVNSTGAVAIWYNNAAASNDNPVLWGANATLTFVYDGSHWVLDEKPPTYAVACSTAAATRDKAATVTGALVVNGTTVAVSFSTANTYVAASLGFNLSGTGDDVIRVDGAVTSASNTFTWAANTTLTLVRRGLCWDVTGNDQASKTATTYLTEGTSNGLMVHRSNNATTGVKIASSVEILQNGTSVAEYGATARIGAESSSHMVLEDTGLNMYLDRGEDGVPEVLELFSENSEVFPGQYTTGVRLATDQTWMHHTIQAGETDAYHTMSVETTNSNGGLARLLLAAHSDADTASISLEPKRPATGGVTKSVVLLDGDEVLIPYAELIAKSLALTNALPVSSGGTGQTGVDKSTSVASNISAASGITVSTAQVATWGKMAQVLIVAKATAAKSGTWTVGTMTAGHRPELVTFGTSNLTAIEQCRMGTDGAVSVAGTLAANASVSLSFTYLLA